VSGIVLKANGLNGTIPAAVGNLTHLTSLDLSGERPTSYTGCVSSDVHNTSIPDALYGLTNLTLINLEYMCLGGKISSKIGDLVNLVEFSIHGNYVGGEIPSVGVGPPSSQRSRYGVPFFKSTSTCYHHTLPSVTCFKHCQTVL